MAKAKAKTKAKQGTVNTTTKEAQIVATGWENGDSPDDIKAELFKAGVPFAKINTVFNKESIAAGYMQDPAKVKEGIAKFMQDVDPEVITDWAVVEEIVQAVQDSGVKATDNQVIAAIRKLVTENDMEMPKRPRKAGGGGAGRKSKIATAILDAVKASPKLTKQDMYEAVLPVVKGPKNASDVTHYFYNVVYGAANGMSLDEVVAATKDDAYPKVDPAVADAKGDAEE